MRTVAGAIAEARATLVSAGVPPHEAAGDAEVLARHVLGWDFTAFALGRNEPVPTGFDRAFGELVTRRSRREPVSQIVGHREFWGLEFEVTRDVLTPRPETELVVQAALDACEKPDDFDAWPPIIVDVGTGSGCIAIALATELTDARFVASDASLAALAIARRNAARHGVDRRIAFLHTDCILPQDDVEIVVSNPPYIPETERDTLAPEVATYEPETALFGGSDGLAFYRTLFDARGQLSENARMIVEVGYDQAPHVIALARRRRFEPVRTYRDLQGIERVVALRALPTGDE